MREDSYEAEGLIVSNQKLTAKQRAAKVEAAQRRAEAAQAKKEAAERTRKIVCVILVLALGIPTIAIAAMGGGKL